MSTYKRLIPCIFIHEGKAVKWFNNHEVLSEDVVALAQEYCESDAKELLVFDLSDSDAEHDIAIDLMKKINRVIHIPMAAGGNIKRLEDAKKILYAGAKRVEITSPVFTEVTKSQVAQCPASDVTITYGGVEDE